MIWSWTLVVRCWSRTVGVLRKFRKIAVKRFRYWIEWLLVSFFARLVPALPLGVLRKIADIAGSLVFLADAKGRAVALANW